MISILPFEYDCNENEFHMLLTKFNLGSIEFRHSKNVKIYILYMKLLAIDEQKSQAYESNLKPKNNRTSFSMLETTFSGCSTK